MTHWVAKPRRRRALVRKARRSLSAASLGPLLQEERGSYKNSFKKSELSQLKT